MAHHARELSLRLTDFIGDGQFETTPAGRARQAILVRHRRKGYFDHDLFADPAWDMLLHLFVAGEEGEPITVSGCLAATSLPELAATRWIDALEERGLLTIWADGLDIRSRFVRLTDPAHHAMRDFWQEQNPI